jgi:hypothetical protein
MPSTRKNRASKATIAREIIYASGSNMNASRGWYTEGQRAGQECVCKIFKTGSVFESSFFDNELKVVHEALAIIEQFNAAHILNNSTILLNIPEVWSFDYDGEKNLIEPMI